MDSNHSRARRYAAAAGIGMTALLAGGLLLGVTTANADTNTATTTSSASTSAYGATGSTAPAPNLDESKPVRPDEKLLTGDTATKVTEAALAKYPGATVLRVESDSDGVYEAHLVTSDGTRVTVEVGSDYNVTGEEQAPTPPDGATGGQPPASPNGAVPGGAVPGGAVPGGSTSTASSTVTG